MRFCGRNVAPSRRVLTIECRRCWPRPTSRIPDWKSWDEQADHDADRYYAEMCRRPAPAEHTATEKSYAELCRIRGEHDRAARQDAAIDRMFPQYAGARA